MNALRERARGLAAGLATMVAAMRGRTVAGPMTAGATHRVKGKAAKKKVRAARSSPRAGSSDVSPRQRLSSRARSMPPPPLAADLCPFLPERFTPESLIAQTLWTMVASLPFVVTLRKMSRRRGVRRWFTTAALFAGVLLTYAFVLIPTASCGGCAGGAFTGGAFGFAFLILAGARKVFFPGPIADHLALGALVAIVPAAYAAGGQIVLREYADAVKAYGYMGEGIKPEEALLAMEDAAGAARPRAFALNEPHAGNFRFDLMGEAHATLPLPDATYMFKAGKLEEGTFCAVPVVGDEWTIADPVPLWYICENDWRMFVSCNDAYEGRYDAKDWYGKTRLEECLTRPERLIAKWREENPISPPPPPMPPGRRPRRRARRPRPSRRVRRRNRRRRPKRRRRRRNRRGGGAAAAARAAGGGHGRGGAATRPPPPGAPTAGWTTPARRTVERGTTTVEAEVGRTSRRRRCLRRRPRAVASAAVRRAEGVPDVLLRGGLREPLQRIRDARGRGGDAVEHR